MLKRTVLLLLMMVIIAGSYAQIGTGWEPVRKKQYFKDSTYVVKGIRYADGTVGNTGLRSGDTVALSSVAVMLVDSTDGYVTPHQLSTNVINAVSRDSLYIGMDGYVHFIKDGYNLRLAVKDSTSTDSKLLTGLKAYWSLNETSGSAIDSSGNGYSGTLSGAISQGTGGILGKAYNFEVDSLGYINLGTTLGGSFGTDDLSVSCWINVESQLGNHGIIGTWNGESCWLIYTASGTITASIFWEGGSAQTISNSAISTGTWHHLVYTANRNGYTKLYIDGTLQSDSDDISAGSALNIHTTNLLNIGTWGDNYTAACFDGKIDEVGIWSRVLTTDEVNDLYNSGSGLTYPF